MCKKKRKRTICVSLALFLCLSLLAGCSSSGSTSDGGSDGSKTTGIQTSFSEETGRAVIDDFAALTLETDSYSAYYDEVLEIVGAYAESGETADLAEAANALSEALTWAQESYDTLEEYEIGEELAEQLAEVGFSEDEYLLYSDELANNLSNYLNDLYVLSEYLVMCYNSGELLDDFLFMYDSLVAEQDYMRQYSYWVVNYWFAEWDEELVEYVQETILANLQSFYSDVSEWDADQDSVETRINAILDSYSELQEEMSDHIGDTQQKINDMQAQ